MYQTDFLGEGVQGMMVACTRSLIACVPSLFR